MTTTPVAAKKVPAAEAHAARARRAAKPAAAKTAAGRTQPAKRARATPKATAAASEAPARKAVKAVKTKLVRDSFTMPSDEYALLDQIKQRALAAAHPVKKSEVLRAGLKALAALDNAALVAALVAVPTIKTGRPKGKAAGKKG